MQLLFFPNMLLFVIQSQTQKIHINIPDILTDNFHVGHTFQLFLEFAQKYKQTHFRENR